VLEQADGNVSSMNSGLVVALAVTSLVLLVPLAFAWVSTNPRRWARVEAVLGRDRRMLSPRGALGFWTGLGSIYLAAGFVQLRSDRPGGIGWLTVGFGLVYVAIGAAAYLLNRRLRTGGGSSQTQVQDRAEPGRPGAGG
jgi:hypothetical protein